MEEAPLYPHISMVYDIPVINIEQLFFDLDRNKKAQAKNLVSCENMAKLESDYFKSPLRRRVSTGSCSSSLGSSSQGNLLETIRHFNTGENALEFNGHTDSAYCNASHSRGSSVSSVSHGLRPSVGTTYGQRGSLENKSRNRVPVVDYKPQQNDLLYGRMENWYDNKLGNGSEKSDYTQSCNGKEKSYGAPLKSEKVYYESVAPSDPLEVEVFPGVFMMLRGSEETWQAVQANHICNAYCICCGSSLYCIRDADFVLCPDCRAISPVYSASDDSSKLRDAKRAGGGVGLGFTPQDLVNWQSEPFFAC
jgi:hypothetical protein